MSKIKKILVMAILLIIIMFPQNVQADVVSVLSDAAPVIQVVEYQIVNGNVEVDSEFQVEITLKNCNEFSTAYNVICSVETENVGLKLADGEVNQNYIQSIGGNETIKIKKRFYIDKTYPYENAKLTFIMSYTGENGKEYTNSTYISPMIKDACKLKITGLTIPQKATTDSRTMITVKCENEGALNISNLSMKIDGDIQESQKNNYLGDIKAGEQLNKNVYINFNRTGRQEIKISFVYNDESGNEYVEEEKVVEIEVSYRTGTTKSKSGSLDTAVDGKLLIVMAVLVIVIIYVIMKLLNSMKKGGKK